MKRAVAGGAKLLTGGKRMNGPGNFYEPTVLADIPKSNPVYYEEIFGPVAMLFRASGIEEAIEIANDSDFGLASSVWTNDEAERARFIGEIEAGAVFVNGMVASDPRLPFGGVKNSGYGRELSEFRDSRVLQYQDGVDQVSHWSEVDVACALLRAAFTLV